MSDRNGFWGFLFVTPAVAFFAVFSIFPIFFGLYLSMTSYDMLSPPLWVGLGNYAALPDDELFRKSLGNTAVFVAGSTFPVWAGSLGLALLFDRSFPGRNLLKVIAFSPVLPPLVVVGIVWKVLLHPNGVITALAGWFTGQSEIQWTTSAGLAPWSMILINDWATIPFFMVIWLAGLAGIPRDLKEAAQIDGAGPLTSFWRIELPLLRSTAVLVACLSTINACQGFIIQYVVSPDKGGPADSTLTLGLLIWKYGFQYFRMGDAAAVSVVLFAIILAITAIQLWLGRSRY
ncbi:MAG: sugar ABC transporter permease [Mesorhizobium sp.]|uniref:carbohydrate ABC transporter permease n=1 Tax=Mesorhizobium sp. TaxID=1871066 RepID=UPI00121EB788|nr:sugar ABC transporter permease [Mesorhizobium sp.]TIN95520.1 MAG: sugar ABC transporter permease [Mesorhizobium sp.]TJU97167.1 MAG: sugar ABC transporter permease [Mesorhizobium sp.]